MVIGTLLSWVAPKSFLSLNIFPPKPKFDVRRDLPNFSGKVVIVTGGNSGIGYEIVLQLLRKGATVYIATRNAERAANAIASLKKATGKTAEFLKLDLGDLKSVRNAAEEFLEREKRLDVLFNNAGIMATPMEMLTTQGYDAQFGTNVLGPYFFTKLLIPALHTSFGASGVKARVLNVSSALLSEAPKNAMGIEWDSLKGGKKRDEAIKGFTPWVLYGQSKLADVTLAKILGNEYGTEIAFCAVHPGLLKSNLSQRVLLLSHSRTPN